jgi:hypothetical protein
MLEKRAGFISILLIRRVAGRIKKRLGTYQNDRPPIHGVVGRDLGQIRLSVCCNTKQKTIEKEMKEKSPVGATIHTDESHAYFHLYERGYHHC